MLWKWHLTKYSLNLWKYRYFAYIIATKHPRCQRVQFSKPLKRFLKLLETMTGSGLADSVSTESKNIFLRVNSLHHRSPTGQQLQSQLNSGQCKQGNTWSCIFNRLHICLKALYKHGKIWKGGQKQLPEDKWRLKEGLWTNQHLKSLGYCTTI